MPGKTFLSVIAKKTCLFMIPLSIITVCLNSRKEIQQTATSILNQIDSDFEWIVIDGGSSDGTVEYLNGLSFLTHFVSEGDAGIYDAMNKGIRLASGSYCLFLNAGDSLFDECVVESIKKYLKADLLIGTMQTCFPEDSNKNYIKRFDDQDIREKYLYYRSLPHPSTFIKRELFEKYGQFDTSFGIVGDHDFFARVLLKGVSKTFVPFCVSTFIMDGISTKLKHSEQLKLEMQRMRIKNFSFLYRTRRAIVDRLL